MVLDLRTERLVIQPFRDEFLEDYYREFTDEITRYQYPDAFPDLDAARSLVHEFVADMERGDMLELVILTQGGEFLGSMGAFGIREETPEVGLWLKSSAHGKGYGHEALKTLLDHLSAKGTYRYYIYEVDVRNLPSIRLVERFAFEKGGCEDVVTESGKELRLQTYRIVL